MMMMMMMMTMMMMIMMIWWYRWVLSLWRPKHNLQPTFPLVIYSMVTGCGGFNSSGGYQNRVKGDKRNVSQLNRHNNTWPGNVREMSNQLLIHDCPFLKNIGQGIPIFPRFFTDFRLMIISFSLTNSSDNSENFESSLVVWKYQRLHELASIWHSRYFWKMIAVLPTFSPAIRHLETLSIPSPSPFVLYAVSRRGLIFSRQISIIVSCFVPRSR